ncbi:SseB family protein [Kineococcus rubinsiae]|uniref:SseB family protein n=1 Tax=Kineococcus rubinsiae TaxID=2609562 RepID=UPI001431E89B|nr:SseB family protein [Kineococcus rubinsiae]NIZ92018.1 SseB family protein [Kineococcus rubinsiae]
MSGTTDSAGVPWAGRVLQPSLFAGDEGGTPPALAEALAAWSATPGDALDERLRAEVAVVAALSGSRVFAPVVAVLGETEVVAAGLAGDKSADMALAVMTRPDGGRALPLFTSLASLTAWRPDARPVPVPAATAALAAGQEECEAAVLDPAGPVRFVVRRAGLAALATETAWTPAALDPAVHDAVGDALAGLPGLLRLRCGAGAQAEVRVSLGLAAGLDREALDALTAAVGERLAASQVVADRVASLELRLLPA